MNKREDTMTIAKIIRAVAIGAAALALCGLAPASAMAGDVKIAFEVADVVDLNVKHRCQLTVPAGADGLVVVQAAQAQGCIGAYSLWTPTRRGATREGSCAASSSCASSS